MGMVCDIATSRLVRLTNFGWTVVVVVRNTHMCRSWWTLSLVQLRELPVARVC